MACPNLSDRRCSFDTESNAADVTAGNQYAATCSPSGCGEGIVESFELQRDAYVEIGRVTTSAGARTARWIPEIDRLVLAVRAAESEPAAVWVYRPATAGTLR